MREAVARFVPDGASVCIGTALEALIPFAAGHELIRQKRRDLTLIGPISDILFDMLVAAGCVRRIQAAWVGNVSAGLGHNYRRAVEKGIPHPIEVEDHSNLSIAVALQAGAMGAPYIPTRSLLGTGLLDSNPTFRQASDPFSGNPVVLVPALRPDVAILHVQRSDTEGHAHCWGTLGVTRQAALAAECVIIVAEEIWPRERILSDPGLVLRAHAQGRRRGPRAFGAYPSPAGLLLDAATTSITATTRKRERWTARGPGWIAGSTARRTGRAFSACSAPRRSMPSASRRSVSPNLSTTEPEPMKITAVEAICLALPMKPLDPPSPWTAATRKQIVVRVKTDTGPTGVGEAFAYGAPLAVCNVIEESLAPLLVGQTRSGDQSWISAMAP
jgi:glutaconate CoA-transferase subunit A